MYINIRVSGFILVMFSLAFTCIAQTDTLNTTFKNELQFVQHLIRYKQHDDALIMLRHLRNKSEFSMHSDTLNFLLGVNYMSAHRLDSSLNAFSRVLRQAAFYDVSRFFTSLSAMYLKEYQISNTALREIEISDSNQRQMWLTQYSGLALLRRDLKTWDSCASLFSYDWFAVKEQQYSLQESYMRIYEFRDKSPAVAGLLSTAVPGLGKIYAKRYGDGFSTFLINLSLGLLAYENFRKDGILDIKTMIFGGIFSIFYIGNIYGSVYSVKMYHDDFNNIVNEQILFDMHVPLRTAYQ